MMTDKKPTIGLLFGGRSAEHEVSLLSAANVDAALRQAGYGVVRIGIDRTGKWFLLDDIVSPQAGDSGARHVALAPGCGGTLFALDGSGDPLPGPVDVVFPVLHGPFGEDGTVQGLLKLAQVAFVGPDVLGSAVAMDKDVCKRLLREAGIGVGDFLSVERGNRVAYETVLDRLGMPVFVKPANLGSSVGISKAHDAAEFAAAVEKAFHFDDKILIERDANGREIECAVLSLDGPAASLPGEIVPEGNHGFYSYDAKYIDADGARLLVPAQLPGDIVAQVRDLSVAVSRILGCEGMVRVDFFLKATGELIVNEVNTLPGFTAISMYPKLWEASGTPPAELVARLVEHAQRRFVRQQELETRHV